MEPSAIFAPCPACGVFPGARHDYRCDCHAAERRIVCERCRKGPHDDGYPPILSASEAIDLGWSRTATGLLDEECASEVLANDYPRGA